MPEKENEENACAYLPPGWRRLVVFRKSGLSAGKSDVYYYSPDGQKFRSKPQLQAHFGADLDLTNFDFRTGGEIPSGKKKRSTRASSPRLRSMKGLPKNKTPPTRVICGLVRQPVTCVLPQSHDFRKTTPPDLSLRLGSQPFRPLPQQRYSMKRLEGLVVYYPDGKVVPKEKDPVDTNKDADNGKGNATDAVNGHEAKTEKSTDDIATVQQVNGEQKKATSATFGTQTQRMSQILLNRMQQEAPMTLPLLAQSAAGGYSHMAVSYPFPMMHSTVGYPQLLPYHIGAPGHNYPPVYTPGPPMYPAPQAAWSLPQLHSVAAEETDQSLEHAEEEVRKQEEKVRQIREKLEAARLKSGQKSS